MLSLLISNSFFKEGVNPSTYKVRQELCPKEMAKIGKKEEKKRRYDTHKTAQRTAPERSEDSAAVRGRSKG